MTAGKGERTELMGMMNDTSSFELQVSSADSDSRVQGTTRSFGHSVPDLQEIRRLDFLGARRRRVATLDSMWPVIH